MNPILDVEEGILSLFQPDALLEADYHDGLRRKLPLQPERSLMLALLEDAVVCFQKHLLSRDKYAKELFREVEAWLLEEQSGRVFSFTSVCEFVGLEPDWMRQELMRWKERALRKHRMNRIVPLSVAAARKNSWPEVRRSACLSPGSPSSPAAREASAATDASEAPRPDRRGGRQNLPRKGCAAL